MSAPTHRICRMAHLLAHTISGGREKKKRKGQGKERLRYPSVRQLGFAIRFSVLSADSLARPTRRSCVPREENPFSLVRDTSPDSYELTWPEGLSSTRSNLVTSLFRRDETVMQSHASCRPHMCGLYTMPAKMSLSTSLLMLRFVGSFSFCFFFFSSFPISIHRDVMRQRTIDT